MTSKTENTPATKPRTPFPWAQSDMCPHLLFRENLGMIVVDEPVAKFQHREDADAFMAIIRTRNDALDALEMAESFIAGFEDDDTQDDVNDRLAFIQETIAKLKGLEMPRRSSSLTIVLEGGMVQSVISDDPARIGHGYDVIDYDTDGSDAADLGRVRQDDGSLSEAIICGGYIEKADVEIVDADSDEEEGRA